MRYVDDPCESDKDVGCLRVSDMFWKTVYGGNNETETQYKGKEEGQQKIVVTKQSNMLIYATASNPTGTYRRTIWQEGPACAD